MNDDDFYCAKCGMSFVVRKPRHGVRVTHCAEPECGRRFWHVGATRSNEFAVVGIDPKDLVRP